MDDDQPMPPAWLDLLGKDDRAIAQSCLDLAGEGALRRIAKAIGKGSNGAPPKPVPVEWLQRAVDIFLVTEKISPSDAFGKASRSVQVDECFPNRRRRIRQELSWLDDIIQGDIRVWHVMRILELVQNNGRSADYGWVRKDLPLLREAMMRSGVLAERMSRMVGHHQSMFDRNRPLMTLVELFPDEIGDLPIRQAARRLEEVRAFLRERAKTP